MSVPLPHWVRASVCGRRRASADRDDCCCAQTPVDGGPPRHDGRVRARPSNSALAKRYGMVAATSNRGSKALIIQELGLQKEAHPLRPKRIPCSPSEYPRNFFNGKTFEEADLFAQKA